MRPPGRGHHRPRLPPCCAWCGPAKEPSSRGRTPGGDREGLRRHRLHDRGRAGL